MSFPVWNEVSERIFSGCGRAGLDSHPFLRKFTHTSPRREPWDFKSELPKVEFPFPPSKFLLCEEESKLLWQGQTGTCVVPA